MLMTQDIDIHLYLPHQQPMLMVDRITAMDEVSVTTVFEVKQSNIFTDSGVLTEAGLIENAAQTCSSIVARSYFIDDASPVPNADVIGFISSIKTIKIHTLPKTGCDVITKAVLVSRFDTGTYVTCMMNCSSYCNGELLLEGEINLFIQER
jgi:predicted hotdog family 3-hydroxylacyl-ACP dehydratase